MVPDMANRLIKNNLKVGLRGSQKQGGGSTATEECCKHFGMNMRARQRGRWPFRPPC